MPACCRAGAMLQDMRGQLCTCSCLALWRAWLKWHLRVLSAEHDEIATWQRAHCMMPQVLSTCCSAFASGAPSGSCAWPCPALEGKDAAILDLAEVWRSCAGDQMCNPFLACTLHLLLLTSQPENKIGSLLRC